MTQLFCAIPSCRVPGEHRPGCDGDCRYGCQPRLATEGWCCDSCVGHMHQLLGVVADLAPDARAVAAGQVRRGPSAGGGGKPSSRPPLDAGATDALDEITAALAKIARGIAYVRGLRAPQSHAEGRTHADPLTRVCEWISRQLEWVRHATDDQGQPYAPTVHAAIRDAASRIRSMVNGPGARRYLGPCGADREHGDLCTGGVCFEDDTTDDCGCWCHRGDPATCDGDVYGRPGATHGTCRTCGASHAQAERREWLDTTVWDRAMFRASEIQEAHGISANTIRVWAHRGHIDIAGHDQHGRALYLLAQVLDHHAKRTTTPPA